MNERMEHLLARAAVFDEDTPVSRRREDLVERAETAGLSREDADRMYDVAEQEGVDPAAAFELVLCGVGVRELAPPNADQWEETQVEAAPAWVTEPAAPADGGRERRARTSFRRLRSIMEHTPAPRDALREFVRQPDVGAVDYLT